MSFKMGNFGKKTEYGEEMKELAQTLNRMLKKLPDDDDAGSDGRPFGTHQLETSEG
jgi:hypothetical protein